MKSLMMITVATLCCAAFAEGPNPGGGMRNRGMRPGGMLGMADPILRIVSNPKAAEKLGITDEQKAKLSELSADRKANREAQKKVREATTKQFELMKSDKIDEAAVMSAIDEVFELRKQMAKDQVRRLIAVKSILTPEQIAKAHEEMKSRFQQRGEGGPRRGGMQGGRRGGPKAGPQQDASKGAEASVSAPEAE